MCWRTVRAGRVRPVFFVFLLVFRFDLSRFCVLVGRSFGRSAAAGRRSAGAGGQPACSPRTVRGSRCATGGSVGFNGWSAAQDGQSAARVRTVRGTRPDGPRGPSRTVRHVWPDGPPEAERFASWLDSSLPSLVLPRVLQGIIPKVRGWSITSWSWRLVCDSIHRLCVTGV
jgi:hypothetical protein